MGVSGDFAGLRALLQKAQSFRRGEVTRATLGRMARAAEQLVDQEFSTRTSPSGKPWAGGASLVRSGRLRASIRIGVLPSGDAFGISSRATTSSGAFYAGTHQYGRTIRAKNPLKPMRFRVGGRWVSAKKVRIPARPIVPPRSGLPQSWRDAFERAALKESP